MATSVTSFSNRRRGSILLALVAATLLTAVVTAFSLSLRDTAYGTGWFLFAAMLFLAAYNLRKKLTYPPLFRSRSWLQLHIYIGLLTVVLFLLHIGLRWPNGRFEMLLAILFVVLSGTGVVGIVISRAVPGRLAVRGQEVLFERIPIFRRQLRDRAEELVIGCVEETDSTTLADFYNERLRGYFDAPLHRWQHLAQSSRPRHKLMHDLRALERYFSEQERTAAEELAELIEAKDALDYHNAMQGLLKGWLFAHIPLTYALLLCATLHMLLIHAFRSGAP